MSATAIHEALRKHIEASDLHLTQIARRAKVRYHNVYRFWTQGRELSIDDANSLFVALTGKSFISIPDTDDHVL